MRTEARRRRGRPAARREASEPGNTPWWAAALLLGVVLVAYLPVFSAGFVWDDDFYVTGNRSLLDWSGLKAIWFDPTATPQYYPLVHTTFWIEQHLWGLWAAGYHAVNLFLHAANAVLVWRLLGRLGIPGGYWVALLFGLHPVQVESVAWITELKNVLSALLYLSAWLAWLRFSPLEQQKPQSRHRWGWYAAASACFVGALLSKTVTCTLPAAILLVSYGRRGRIDWREARALAPWFVVAIALGLTTVYLEKHQVGASGSEWSFSLADRLLIAGRAWWFYLGKLAWPDPLAFIYPRWTIVSTQLWQYLFPLAAVAVLAGAFVLRKRLGRGPICALLFFSGTLVPALGFFDIYPMRYSFVADHFQYLACLGPLVLAVTAAQWLSRKLDPIVRTMSGWALGGGVLVALAILTWQQAGIYHDPLSLWTDTIRKNPGCWMAYDNLGNELQLQGRTTEALSAYRAALRIDPSYVDARVNAATSLISLGRTDEALTELREAVREDPELVEAQCHLANLLAERQDFLEAARHYRAALELNSRSVAAHYNYGNLLYRCGQLDEAEAQFKAALDARPSHSESHNALGKLDAQRGDTAKAIAEFQQAVESDGRNLVARQNLAEMLSRQKRYSEAIDQLREALRIDPGNAALARRLEALERAGKSPQKPAG